MEWKTGGSSGGLDDQQSGVDQQRSGVEWSGVERTGVDKQWNIRGWITIAVEWNNGGEEDVYQHSASVGFSDCLKQMKFATSPKTVNIAFSFGFQ